MKKIAVLIFAFIGWSLFLTEETGAASAQSYESIENEVKKACNYDPAVEYGKEIPFQTANCLLTTTAMQMEVPAEIVKAVASQENASWQQFDKEGKPLQSGDFGYGIMQMTVFTTDPEKIKNNAIYNIYSGVLRLKENYGSPYVEKNYPDKFLEKWYFTVLKYNGNYAENSPINKCEGVFGSRNTGAYQEEVYKKISDSQYITSNVDDLLMKAEDFSYDCDLDQPIIKYNKSNFTVNAHLTETKHAFNENDTLLTVGSPAIRKTPTKDPTIPPIPYEGNIIVKPEGQFVYDATSSSKNQFTWYPVTFKDKKGYVASSYLKRILTRHEGENRYETSAAVSKEGWKQSETVVIATGNKFPDALSGAPLAAKYNAPLILLDGRKDAKMAPDYNRISFDEIRRLKAKKAFIIGAEAVIPEQLADQLKGMGLTVTRIAGDNRYETSAEVAKYLSSKTAVVATGKNYPDALSVASYAAKNGFPILLTDDKDVIREEIKSALDEKEKTLVIGSVAVIKKSVESQLKNPVRYGGEDRYETSRIINEQLKMGKNEIFAATGRAFPDALSGSVLAAKNNASVLLMDNRGAESEYNVPTLRVIDQYPAATILGSKSAIPEFLEEQIIERLK
ncbi:cell wall-binding repeat-containing protein [Metabacillus indicus]|uniref:cell wall-binding repeat-containing protein n=1 Tax=Metabacillus indicus TaxID=246786 RepID=UPI00068ABD04|nr:cell wall-binding repeat-containing protein [Metabacillus indicus]